MRLTDAVAALTGAGPTPARTGTPARSGSSEAAPLRISVLVDLELSERAGGHVRCWERLAQAARSFPELIDLTVHFQGRRPALREQSANVRYRLHRPAFSTRRLSFLSEAPDHTDLAPIHPGVLAQLRQADVVHTTDAYFALARTARLAKALGGPAGQGPALVNSIHTDTPAYTRIYAERSIRGLFGTTAASRLLVERLRLPERFAEGMRRRLAKHLEACDGLLVPDRSDPIEAARRYPGKAVGQLRRGVDKETFHPARRDRAALLERCGLERDRTMLLFVGRIDRAKGLECLIAVTRAAIERGHRPHLVLAGHGNDMAMVRDRLGDSATLLGTLEPSDLGRVYASADAFVFPSEVEVSANVVLEAKASGLPVLVTPDGGGAYVHRNGEDGIVVERPELAAWTEALEPLLASARRRGEIGRAARRDIEASQPDWRDVLRRDLLPVWQEAAARSRAGHRAHVRAADPHPRAAS